MFAVLHVTIKPRHVHGGLENAVNLTVCREPVAIEGLSHRVIKQRGIRNSSSFRDHPSTSLSVKYVARCTSVGERKFFVRLSTNHCNLVPVSNNLVYTSE
jgi:hypothetical protein